MEGSLENEHVGHSVSFPFIRCYLFCPPLPSIWGHRSFPKLFSHILNWYYCGTGSGNKAVVAEEIAP